MSWLFFVVSQIVLTLSSCPYDSWGSGCNNPKFMVDSKVCAAGCPTLYYFYQQYFDIGWFSYCSKPTGSDAILFTLILSKVQDLTLTYVSDLNDSNKKFVNPGGIPYISETQNSPLPTLDRGFYFANTSSMTSNQSYTPGLYFILNLIIKPLGSGEILNIQINSTQYVRIWADISGYYKISALIFNSNGAQIAVSGASSVKYSLSWHSLSVSLSQLCCDLGSITFYIDGNEAGKVMLSNSEISFPTETYIWTFGNTGRNNSFKGFIYWIQARADSNINYGIMTITIDCTNNQYWDGSACQNCEADCPTWPWCIRGGDCSFCSSTDCSSCYGYSLSMCKDHFSNQIPKISRLVCWPGCQTCTGIEYYECTSCQIGYYFLNIQCLPECPTGYTQNSTTNSCDLGVDYIYLFLFPKIILLDSISGKDVGSSNINSYPNYDPNDPYPAYNRGYYFNPSSYLKTSYMLSPSHSITAWIRPITDGLLLIKYISGTTQWSVKILPSGQPELSVFLSDSSTILSVTGASSALNYWFFIVFDCDINSDGTTTAKSYIDTANLATSSSTIPLYPLDSSSGDLYLGHYSSGFTGFAWKVKLIPITNSWDTFYVTSGCLGNCSKCAGDLTCLDSCSINQYFDGSICKNCIDTCTKGCRNSDTCRLCKTKECATCTAFSGANSCLTCITNAVSDGAGGCKCADNAFWVSSSQSCEICDNFCSTCLKTAYFECSACSGTNFLIGTVCFSRCPYGFGSPCSPVSTAVIDLSFDGDFLGQYGLFVTGTDFVSFQFFNNPEALDPIPAYKRGLFFDGSKHLSTWTNPQLFHSFSLGAWIYVIIDGSWMQKSILINYSSLGSFTIRLQLWNNTNIPVTLSSSGLLNTWKYLSVTSIYYLGQTTLAIYMNGAALSSLLVPDRIFRDSATSTITIGKSSTSGFVGFVRSFQMWNTPITDFSSYINAACGSGSACLWSCDLSHYYDGANCVSCNSCSLGCVRGNTCNICYDLLCLKCTGFDSGKCTQCVINASLNVGVCACNPGYGVSSDGFSCFACYTGCSQCTGSTSHECKACFSGYFFYGDTGECLTACPTGYIINPGTNICVKCDVSCKTCTSASYLDCLECADSYYKITGICLGGCPSGYSLSANGCVQEKIFDLDLNTLNGVIYDKASSIPVVTGSTNKFYPNYEPDDPIPAYLRGFWFNGQSSVLRLPEFSNYTSPKLIIAPTFTISIWLNTETSFSALLSKNSISDNYSALYFISLISSKPAISLLISSSPFFYSCQASLNNYEWSHIVYTLEAAQNGYNKISCYINGVLDSSGMTGYGAFLDIGPHTTMAIGAQISSSAVYNFYQGFIYTIQIFNTAKSISSLSTTSCIEPCSVCPISQACIPNCKINEYWSGPAYNKCYNCNIKCKKTCRDWRSTCSLCSNLLCDVCTDYSASGCSACKEYAINPDSCICDINYVLDASNNSSCIPLEAGGFRDPNGIFYPCPNYCTICESLTKCSACVENASLINNLCYCNIGYNGTKNCILVPFSAKLSVLSDNSLYLTFSDSLAKKLTTNDFTIKIAKLGNISYKIEEVNNTCYYITIKITEEVSKGTLATLEFLNLTEVRSVSNGLLNSSEISASLNSYDPAPYSPTIAAVSSQAETIAQTTVALVAALSIINPNPSSLWSMMNTLQILSYLTLSGIPLSKKISAFLNSLNSFNLFPNAFIYITNKDEGKTPYSQAKEFGFDTDLILLNTGNDFTLILASFLAFPIILFFSQCSFRWIGKKFMKTVKAYQFAFYLRFWIQCYLELGAAASIGLITFGFNNITQIANFLICIAIYILHAIAPAVFFWFSYKNKNRIQSREKTFNRRFSSFFYEFRTDRGLLATQYYFVFFIRRLIYIISLVFLRNYPQTEVTINVVLSIMTIMHLFFFWPFKDYTLQICNLLTEIGIFFIMTTISIYLFNLDQENLSIIEEVIVSIVIAIMGIQILASIVISVRTLYKIIKYKLEKQKFLKVNSCEIAKIK
ncbi:unnamed protein product [Blepharisma stoltei]|uniref:TNFR-Cys domain-containing protein n=1 Tax=Blepharisma stoltei TaxID=1481888 RepID=A0AAU9KPG3_9CILI|nr:unnamed protein product [Blepharisma stoltei]